VDEIDMFWTTSSVRFQYFSYTLPSQEWLAQATSFAMKKNAPTAIAAHSDSGPSEYMCYCLVHGLISCLQVQLNYLDGETA
jgi:hypothetical protein